MDLKRNYPVLFWHTLIPNVIINLISPPGIREETGLSSRKPTADCPFQPHSISKPWSLQISHTPPKLLLSNLSLEKLLFEVCNIEDEEMQNSSPNDKKLM